MLPIDIHESRPRGSGGFPLEYHFVDERHPRYEMPYHWHEEFEAMRVLKGRFVLRAGDADYALQAGDMAFVAGGVLHGGMPQACAYECLVFDMRRLLLPIQPCRPFVRDIMDRRILLGPFIPGDRNRDNRNRGDRNRDDGMPGDGGPGAALAAAFAAQAAPQPGGELTTLGCLLQFIGLTCAQGAYRAVEAPDDPQARRIGQLKRVLELIESAYREPLTLSRLAAEAGMAPKYFCRFFKEATHRTAIEYLRYYRIEKACVLLASGGCSVTDAALDTGFGDVAYFIRTFKRLKGMTPGQYARRLKPEGELRDTQ